MKGSRREGGRDVPNRSEREKWRRESEKRKDGFLVKLERGMHLSEERKSEKEGKKERDGL